MKCCICEKDIKGFGNNPEGAAWLVNGKLTLPSFEHNSVCCDECNLKYVISGRFYRIFNDTKYLKEKQN